MKSKGVESATKILSDEHKHILKVIDAIEKECYAQESGKEIDDAFFDKAIEFIRGYADKFHRAKEEAILFKEMNKNAAQLHCNPVEQMLYEHDLGRKFVKGMEEGVKKKDKPKILKAARGYAQLLREHIFKEDNVLYPMAEGALNEEAKKAMAKRFKEAEQKKFIKGVKEKYLSIAAEFENRK